MIPISFQLVLSDASEGLQGKVCAVLCDIRKIARKKKSSAAKKVREFCTRNLATGLTVNGILAKSAVALVWADFPTSLPVKHFEGDEGVPAWTSFLLIWPQQYLKLQQSMSQTKDGLFIHASLSTFRLYTHSSSHLDLCYIVA